MAVAGGRRRAAPPWLVTVPFPLTSQKPGMELSSVADAPLLPVEVLGAGPVPPVSSLSGSSLSVEGGDDLAWAGFVVVVVVDDGAGRGGGAGRRGDRAQRAAQQLRPKPQHGSQEPR